MNEIRVQFKKKCIIISLFFKAFDPFVPFENLFSAVFFGGLLDAFKKANVNPQATAASANSALFRKENTDGNNLEDKSKESKKKE